MNRERSPQVWWSPEIGLIWLDDEHGAYRYADGDRVAERFVLPAHAVPLFEAVED